ncbi:hypothetical protein JDV02_002200 [Purpureocillium takamizusanense]|uniref:SP-RING-type domain-containing protein n=1 Tax=Purpureocillium takamizusanense TaxID=2060973 RepID=A0A9Q8QAX5_9HYPO|nr:uncharacterized protein JDV02_002200 [Purpureocillium takamizusanense]UNI15689.1 hypothetical protein JDV02_002200 [Purpureocillium takamizusanense]
MPPPKEPRQRAAAASRGIATGAQRSNMHSLSDTNETSYAFLGALRPSWMTRTDDAPIPASRRLNACRPMSVANHDPAKSSRAVPVDDPHETHSPAVTGPQNHDVNLDLEQRRQPAGPSRVASSLPSPLPSGEASPIVSATEFAPVEQPNFLTPHAVRSPAGAPTPPTATPTQTSSLSRGPVQATGQTCPADFANSGQCPSTQGAVVATVPAGTRPQAHHRPDQPVGTAVDEAYITPAPQIVPSSGATHPPRTQSRNDRDPPGRNGPSFSSNDVARTRFFGQLRDGISQCIQAAGGVQFLPMHERARLDLLIKACVAGDFGCLLLLQLYSIWSIRRGVAHRLLSLNPETVDASFQNFPIIVGDNNDLVSNMHWFAAFPCNDISAQGGRCPPALTHFMAESSNFIVHMASKWYPMLAEVRRRGFPPLVSDMRLYLRCSSPVFLRCIFTSFCRSIGMTSWPAQLELQKLFELDVRNEDCLGPQSEALQAARQDVLQRYAWTVRHIRSNLQHFGPFPGGQSPRTPNTLTNPTMQVAAQSPPVCVSCPPPSVGSQVPAQGGSHSPLYYGTSVTAITQGEVYSMPAHQSPVSTVLSSHGPVQGVDYTSPLSSVAREALHGRLVPSQNAIVNPQTNSYMPSQGQTRGNVAQHSHSSQSPSSQMHYQQQTPLLPHSSTRRACANTPPISPQSLHSVNPLAAREYPRSEYDTTSLRNGLHLAHLRSPSRTPRVPDWKRYFQYVSHFAVAPMEVPPRRGIRILQFSLTEAEAALAMSAEQDPRTVLFSNGSTRYRLRTCKYIRNTSFVDASTWVISPTFWPPHIFLEFNGEPVHPRRRVHAHTDQPIELTRMSRLGVNQLRVSLPSTVEKGLEEPSTFFMAVEVVTTSDYTTLLTQVQEREHFSLEGTKTEMQRRLNGVNFDDDIVIQDKTIHIGVTDPFSSSLFTIPVRGVDCKHLECFDLEIWLQTRKGKPSKQGGEPSLVDDWKCPICRLDARPVSLRVDDYFANVRASLSASGVGATVVKFILVDANGDWTLMREPSDKGGNGAPDSRSRKMPSAEDDAQDDYPAQSLIVLDD